MLNILRIIISEELKKSRISFCSVLKIDDAQTKNVFHINDTFHKWQSVLKWAGESYNSDQLTVENFLRFYKEKYITNKIFEDDNYYVKANIESFIPNDFIIENIPLQNKDNKITLENNIKILVSKEQFEQELTKFAEVTIQLWRYYKLETYNDNHRLVFNMNQANFDKLVESVSVFESGLETKNLSLIFTPIFDFFKTTLDSENSFKIKVNNYSNFEYKINWTKNEKSFNIQLLKKFFSKENSPIYDVNFSYNGFGYSFFFKPDNNEYNIDDGEYKFLQIIEFKVD